MPPLWCLLVAVAVEAGWLAALGPRLWRNLTDGRPEEERPTAVRPAWEVLVGVVFLVSHLPLILLAFLISTRLPGWVRFGLIATLIALNSIQGAYLLAWLSGAFR